MSRGNFAMKNQALKLMFKTPHALYAKWKIEDNHIKEFIKKFGYWAWDESTPALKICLNDSMKIIGEQNSFILSLKEGEKECIFFIPLVNKVYWVEYGRYFKGDIFIPFIKSNILSPSKEQKYPITRLPNELIYKL